MGESLKVVALISGGKDSFFTACHCLHHGHTLVALANLLPPFDSSAPTSRLPRVGRDLGHGTFCVRPEDIMISTNTVKNEHDDGNDKCHAWAAEAPREDLNSFMYQTVGHQVLPLYAAATGLPLYRQQITGGPQQSERDYEGNRQASGKGVGQWEEDEAESMTRLLQAVKAHHPEVNAVCAGAILSTYQRTRVESVAVRLGLTPLAFLWKYPSLPLAPLDVGSDQHAVAVERQDSVEWQRQRRERDPLPYPLLANSQLLADMEDVGLDARILKIASAGMDDEAAMLWKRVSSRAQAQRIQQSLNRFARLCGQDARGDDDVILGEEAAILGEGGEFETLVIDGPLLLFPRRIHVPEARVSLENDDNVVREGGGCSWLRVSGAQVVEKDAASGGEGEGHASSTGASLWVPTPALLEDEFQDIYEQLSTGALQKSTQDLSIENLPLHSDNRIPQLSSSSSSHILQWSFYRPNSSSIDIASEIEEVVGMVRDKLRSSNCQASDVINTMVLLQNMSDFVTINRIYSTLFPFANPPSRVTISCGDMIPKGARVVLNLTVQPGLHSLERARDGLHVQSRSYWAPANIGPYSQAISVPIHFPESSRRQRHPGHADREAGDSEDEDEDEDAERLYVARGGSRTSHAVAIAGQIPLIPYSMQLPAPRHTPASRTLEVVLALQHLWRIGREMKVQFWSGSVAYIARQATRDDRRQMARLVDQAWQLAHVRSSADDDEEEEKTTRKPRLYRELPDRNVLSRATSDRLVPASFAVEIEALPRASEVEWHAQLGFRGVCESGIHLTQERGTTSSLSAEQDVHWTRQRQRVETAHGVLYHVTTWVEEPMPMDDGSRDGDSLSSLTSLIHAVDGDAFSPPYLAYYASSRFQPAATESPDVGFPVVPAHSLWTQGDSQLRAVWFHRIHVVE